MKKIYIIIILILLSLSISAQLLITEEAVTLKTKSGDIHGTLRVPPAGDEAIPVAIIIAGSGPTDRDGNNPQMKNNSLKMLAEGLFFNNIASLCFDKRGIGGSRQAMKEEIDLRFEDYIDDVRQWVDLLAEDKRFSEIVIAGHSEGSLIGMVAAQGNRKVSKYISLAGIGEPAANILKKQLEKQFLGQPPAVKDMVFGYIDKLEGGETLENVPASLNSLFRASVQPYMISWFRYNPQTEIGKLDIPVLIVQGSTDIQVGVEQTEMLAKANDKAKKVIIRNMNHVLKDCEETDQQSQLKTYIGADIPINKQLVKDISNFILGR